VLAAMLSSAALEASASDDFSQHSVSMRTRLQQVNDAWLGDAKAITTRIKLVSVFNLDALVNRDEQQWQVLIQSNLVYAFNDGDYNSVTVQKNTSPIPDPKGFNWNQIYLGFTSEDDWQLKLGRQMLSFDNERMVGAIEYWQTPQSFDALKFEFNNHIDWRLQYVYSTKVHRIFGRQSKEQFSRDDVRYAQDMSRPASQLGVHKLDAHLINIAYKTEDDLNIVGYNYWLKNLSLSRLSNNTLGLRVSDEFKPAQLKYRYTVEVATQRDIGNNPDNYSAWYSLLEASIGYKSHRLQLSQEILSQEILSQDNSQGFRTPLGTNHKFQGWADVFTGYAMQTGLRDQYITYRGRINKLRWRAKWHRFKNYSNGDTIGNEFDIELAYRATRKWEVKLVYADYNAKSGLDYFAKANHDLSTWSISVAYNI